MYRSSAESLLGQLRNHRGAYMLMYRKDGNHGMVGCLFQVEAASSGEVTATTATGGKKVAAVSQERVPERGADGPLEEADAEKSAQRAMVSSSLNDVGTCADVLS